MQCTKVTYTSVAECPCRVEIFDTAGLDSDSAFLLDISPPDVDALMIVYSVTDRNSFDCIRAAYERFSKADTAQRPTVIVATKADLYLSRDVSEAEGRLLATELGCKICECSAKDPESVNIPFMDLIRAFREVQKLCVRDESPTGPEDCVPCSSNA
jgi:GTPase SAR1 family protein